MAANAIADVAHSFALPAADEQVGTVLRILLKRYTSEEICLVAEEMPYDEALAEKLRYTRGLTVVDFATRIDQLRLSDIDHETRRKTVIMEAVFNYDGSSDDNNFVGYVNAILQANGYDRVSLTDINEVLR